MNRLGVEARDWDQRPLSLAVRAEFMSRRLWSRLIGASVSGPAGRSARLRYLAARPFDRLAWRRVSSACSLLASGRIVVTDRLHGHILALLLGQPQVLLDNSYGKVNAFYETWTASCHLVTWADSIERALEIVRAMSESGSDLPGPLPRAATNRMPRP